MFSKAVAILLFAAFNNVQCESYNTETYYIPAGTNRIIYNNNDDKYFVLNVGIPEVLVQIIHGNHASWNGVIGSCTLKHAEHCYIRAWESYPYKALKVTNYENNMTSYVHYMGLTYDVNEYDDSPTKFLDLSRFSQTFVSTGATFVPFVGESLATVVGYFWPKQKDDVWDKILDKVSKLIDDKVRSAVYDLLNGDISHYRTRMSLLDYEIRNPNITDLDTHYVNIMEDMIGFEKKFVFEKSPDAVNTNFLLLPLYCNVITLKLTFYIYGIKNWELLKLNQKQHVARLKYYISNLLYDEKGVINHVNSVVEKKLAKTYDNTYPEHIYDTFANLRQFAALNGFEFLPVWKAMVADPLGYTKPEIPVVAFSTQFGRNTAEQSAQMIQPVVPLQPKVINGTLNAPEKVFIFKTPQNRIGGLKIFYANGDSAFTGPTREGDHVECDLKGGYIESIEARGTGQIDGLKIRLSDGREVSAGVEKGSSRKFSMGNHRIVGILMTNSLVRVPKGQAANIAVSYQAITVNGTVT